jgi:hypothetical protein
MGEPTVSRQLRTKFEPIKPAPPVTKIVFWIAIADATGLPLYGN